MGILGALKKKIRKWAEAKKKEAALREVYGEDYERLRKLVKAGIISEEELLKTAKRQVKRKLPRLVLAKKPSSKKKRREDWVKRMEKMFSVDFDVAGGLYGGKRRRR